MRPGEAPVAVQTGACGPSAGSRCWRRDLSWLGGARGPGHVLPTGLGDTQVMQVKGNLKHVVRLEKGLEFSPKDSREAEAEAAGGDRG